MCKILYHFDTKFQWRRIVRLHRTLNVCYVLIDCSHHPLDASFYHLYDHLLPVSSNVIVLIVLRASSLCYINFLMRRDAQPVVLIAMFRPDRETRKNSRERRFNERIFRLQCFGSSSHWSYVANMQSFSSVCW